ncbi:MAG: Clp protease N-terminal domain-containing protein [Planctomycetota bacterium]
MDERYSDHAHRVWGLAHRHATRLQHAWIGSVHLLLALLEEPRGLAGRVLRDQGLTLDYTAQAVRALTPPEGAVPDGALLPSADGQQVLDGALAVAGDDKVDTEHLLLSLLADKTSAAHNVLIALGSDPGAIKDAVIARVKEGPARASGPSEVSTDQLGLVGAAALNSLLAARDLVRLLSKGQDDLQTGLGLLEQALAELQRKLPG